MRTKIITALLLSVFFASQAQALVVWEVENSFFKAVFQTEGAYKYAPDEASTYEQARVLSFYIVESRNGSYPPTGDWNSSGDLSFVFGDSLLGPDFAPYDKEEPYIAGLNIRISKTIELFTNSLGEAVASDTVYQLNKQPLSNITQTAGPNLENCVDDLRYLDSVGAQFDRNYCNSLNTHVGYSLTDIRYIGDKKDWRKTAVSEPPMLPLLIAPLIALAFLRLKKSFNH